MTPAQVVTLRSTWELMLRRSDELGTRFYVRLFTARPELQSLFQDTDMEAQADHLIRALAMIVRGADRLETLRPVLATLGERHWHYGVAATDYASVGAVLLESFEALLGEEFTPSAHAAWSAAFAEVSTAMMSAPRPAALDLALQGAR